jgi:hypothetical protein
MLTIWVQIINTRKKCAWNLNEALLISTFAYRYFRYLDHNQFSGRIPEPFYKHPFLKEMWVSYHWVNHPLSFVFIELNNHIIWSWQVHRGKCIPAWCQPHWFAQSAWSFWFRIPCLMKLKSIYFFRKYKCIIIETIVPYIIVSDIAKIGISIFFAKDILSLSINNSFLSLLFMIFSRIQVQCTI